MDREEILKVRADCIDQINALKALYREIREEIKFHERQLELYERELL